MNMGILGMEPRIARTRSQFDDFRPNSRKV